MHRARWILFCTAFVGGCAHEPSSIAPGRQIAVSAPVPAAPMPAAPVPATPVPAPPEVTAALPAADDDAPAEATLAQLLAAATDLKAFAVFRNRGLDETVLAGEWLIVSGMEDSGRGASCLAKATATRCVDFAGYSRGHLAHVFAREHYPAVPTPPWAQRMLAISANVDPTNSDWGEVEVHLDDSSPVLGVHVIDGVRFAVRRDGRWRLSQAISGGGSSIPFYFGSLDLTAATGRPSIGLIVGSYVKEAAVRYETDELVVLGIDDELEELGRAVIGTGMWIQTDDTRFGPFDPKDPNHYLIRLAPHLRSRGVVQLDIAERHTPQKLHKLTGIYGGDPPLKEVDNILRLVGRHRLGDLLRIAAPVKE